MFGKTAGSSARGRRRCSPNWGRSLSARPAGDAPGIAGPDQARRGRRSAHYQVRLTAEGSMSESKGYVMTLDDMTELVTAQRNSAWADVARRIAHEIKNPLTPIQLSAERLRRIRYATSPTTPKSSTSASTPSSGRSAISARWSTSSRHSPACRAALKIRRLPTPSGTWSSSKRTPAGNRIAVDLPEEPIDRHFDHRLVSQALTNIIKNAVEAIENAGHFKKRGSRV